MAADTATLRAAGQHTLFGPVLRLLVEVLGAAILGVIVVVVHMGVGILVVVVKSVPEDAAGVVRVAGQGVGVGAGPDEVAKRRALSPLARQVRFVSPYLGSNCSSCVFEWIENTGIRAPPLTGIIMHSEDASERTTWKGDIFTRYSRPSPFGGSVPR
jgi:hypothetical protein